MIKQHHSSIIIIYYFTQLAFIYFLHIRVPISLDYYYIYQSTMGHSYMRQSPSRPGSLSYSFMSSFSLLQVVYFSSWGSHGNSLLFFLLVSSRVHNNLVEVNFFFYQGFCGPVTVSHTSGPPLTAACPPCAGDPRTGCSTPGGVSQEQNRRGESPPSTCWPCFFWCSPDRKSVV